MKVFNAIISLLFVALALAAPPAMALEKPEMVKLLQLIDERQGNRSDYKAMVYLEQTEKGKVALFYDMIVYRRDADDKQMIVFVGPKAEQGKGYLRIDRNLWLYDPNVGKWERRTERERIGGTGSRRSDFDRSRLSEEYEPTFEGEEKLGAVLTYKLRLKAKAGVDVAYPEMLVWIDKQTSNILRRQDFSLSSKLMRTAYYPKWQKVHSEAKKGDVYVPQEVHIFDEVEKDNSTLIRVKDVDLQPLDANMFTKGWLESRSR